MSETAMNDPTYYKVLGEDGKPYYGGKGTWPLPQNGEPGEWLHVKGGLVPCKRGLHVVTIDQLVYWLGPTLYEVEIGSERIVLSDKIVAREARLLHRIETWNERTARLLACDCAEQVLPTLREALPDDDRPAQAIAVARRFANEEATEEERAVANWAARLPLPDNPAAEQAIQAARAASSASGVYLTTGVAAESIAYWAADRATGGARDQALYWVIYREAHRAGRTWQSKRLQLYLNGDPVPALTTGGTA